MFRKVTLALVAAASLGAMALAPSTASAGGVFWPKYPHHHHHHWGHGHGFGVGFVDSGYSDCYVTRRVLTPYGYPLADREHLLLIQTQFVRLKPRSRNAAGVFRRNAASLSVSTI